jgi:acetolactate synthase-1/2/3 large subunit
MIVAEALAAGLHRHGVEMMFSQCFPIRTQHVLPKYGIRQIGFRTENAGGVMADGYARMTRRIAVVAAQGGPGATLLVPPLAEAFAASVPLLAIVEECTSTHADRNAFQELDHFKLFDGCSKWTRRVDRADRLDDYLDMAIARATSGRPGPVVLIFPVDFLNQTAVPSTRTVKLGHFPLDRIVPERRLLAEAAELIATAKRPLIIAGGGVHLSDASAELVQLAETVGIPVATTNMGKGAIDERAPLCLGVFGNTMGRGSMGASLREFASTADLILLVGSRTNANGTDAWTLFPKDARFIHIDMDGGEIGRNYEALRLAGDAKATLAALLVELEGDDFKGRAETRARIAAATEAARNAKEAHLDVVGPGRQGALRPEHMLRILDSMLQPGDVVTTDASFSTNWVSAFISARGDGARILEPRGLAGLGWGMPLAMGAKLARPSANVFAIVGDGGFAHCWSELETARRLDINVVTIVLNNGILGYQFLGEELGFGDHSPAAEFAPVDHAAIARACGCHGEQVSSPSEVKPALERAIASGRPALIDLMVDPLSHPPLSFMDKYTEAQIAALKDRRITAHL